MAIKEWIVPQDEVFFSHFERLAAVAVLASDRLVDLVSDFSNVAEKVGQIEQLEHEGDRITHEIYEQLNKTFITPLEPEEISRLASALDDILDYIKSTATRMYHYRIQGTDSHMVELARLIHLSVAELEDAIKGIRTLRNPRQIEERCIEVNRLENLADDALHAAYDDLFQMDDPIAIIKRKDIYEYLEIATDKCEDVANVLSDIAIRHS